jgi:hypothetical protein
MSVDPKSMTGCRRGPEPPPVSALVVDGASLSGTSRDKSVIAFRKDEKASPAPRVFAWAAKANPRMLPEPSK